MPVARTCFYCRKTFLKSTHEMFSHVQSCSKYKEFVKINNENKKNHYQSSCKIKTNTDEINREIN